MFSPERLWPLLDAAAAQEHIRVKGLMAIPPVNNDDAQNRRYLAQVCQSCLARPGSGASPEIAGHGDPFHGDERRF